MALDAAKYIPWLPALAAVLCGLCAMSRRTRVWAAVFCILGIAGAFALTLVTWSQFAALPVSSNMPGVRVPVFDWIHVGGAFAADIAYYIDNLTLVMLLVVTGIGLLVAIYAAGYMAGDHGYARFFAGVSLFIFAMTTLVLADNLVLLYLGWEGVGLCSYLLIGFYYTKPGAVAAAKKAFIVNRVGDLGFAIGIFLIYLQFGTVRFFDAYDPTHQSGLFQQWQNLGPVGWSVQVIPFLLMLGAFGKSAQLPLYVWLPDAMEGPTPVSALIHAATMVTAGVYLIARLFPLFALSPYALPTVAVVGGLTACFAATIALCQYDIKRVWAYSTISQLGYMFLGVGVASTVGGIFHLFTHAFFKALLFLTAGSVMHAMAGQLDLRKMSGLGRKMPVTAGLMLVGCLALAGFPLTAGFYSKDMILADTLARGLGPHGQTLFVLLAALGLFTAFLTAFYTFRLWFRVFLGPTQYEMGHEHHGVEEETAGHDAAEHPHDAEEEAAEKQAAGADVGKSGIRNQKSETPHGPHEVNWLMNGPLVVLALGALAAGYVALRPVGAAPATETATQALHGAAAAPAGNHEAARWIGHMVLSSTARPPSELVEAHHAQLWGLSVHTAMVLLSSAAAVLGILLAGYFHWLRRPAADRVAAAFPNVVRVLAHKYYVDELYDAVIVRPLYRLGELCYLFDRMVIDGALELIALIPRALGFAVRPAQRGALQGYGLGMLAGAAAVAALVCWWTLR